MCNVAYNQTIHIRSYTICVDEDYGLRLYETHNLPFFVFQIIAYSLCCFFTSNNKTVGGSELLFICPFTSLEARMAPADPEPTTM